MTRFLVLILTLNFLVVMAGQAADPKPAQSLDDAKRIMQRIEA